MSKQTSKQVMQQALDALNDWLNTYAEELCDHERVALARKRVEDSGGTLAYIAGITQDLQKAIEDCKQADEQEHKKLTDDDIIALRRSINVVDSVSVKYGDSISFARAIEARVLGENV